MTHITTLIPLHKNVPKSILEKGFYSHNFPVRNSMQCIITTFIRKKPLKCTIAFCKLSAGSLW